MEQAKSLEENYPTTQPNRSFNDFTQLEQQIATITPTTEYSRAEVDALLAEKADADDLTTEATERANEDTRLDGLIDSLDTTKADQDSLTEEITNRTNADTAIRTDVNAALEAEGAARSAADTQLQANIDGKAAQSALEKEVEDREDADTAIRTDVNAAFEQEATARETADNALAASIAAETTARTTKETELETEIATKQDELSEGPGIAINKQNEICAKIDGTTIVLNSAGLLSIPAYNIVLSVASIDGGFPDSTYMDDDVIDGGYPETVY